jgi:DMSO/TMAO reductase YedYZ molybdopterin-dependent catalytic subunit
MVANNFADYRLQVGGLVGRPLSVTLPQLRQMPSRAQITRHDCVEGWSAIGKWQGPKLGALLKAAQIRDSARYVVFTCADLYGGTPYYESVDLVDAFHPQTILAWALNDQVLDVAHGAPVRLRVERQLGYNTSCGSTRSTASLGSARARVAIGKITSIMIGMRGSDPLRGVAHFRTSR